MLTLQEVYKRKNSTRRLVIGINTTNPKQTPCIGCGCVAYTGEDPYPKNLNSYLKHTLFWTATTDPNPANVVTALTWRLIEKLYINEYIKDPAPSSVRILLKSRYKDYEFEFPSLIVRSHWLISTSNMLLNTL
jgi:hypothetical protein